MGCAVCVAAGRAISVCCGMDVSVFCGLANAVSVTIACAFSSTIVSAVWRTAISCASGVGLKISGFVMSVKTNALAMHSAKSTMPTMSMYINLLFGDVLRVFGGSVFAGTNCPVTCLRKALPAATRTDFSGSDCANSRSTRFRRSSEIPFCSYLRMVALRVLAESLPSPCIKVLSVASSSGVSLEICARSAATVAYSRGTSAASFSRGVSSATLSRGTSALSFSRGVSSATFSRGTSVGTVSSGVSVGVFSLIRVLGCGKTRVG